MIPCLPNLFALWCKRKVRNLKESDKQAVIGENKLSYTAFILSSIKLQEGFIFDMAITYFPSLLHVWLSGKARNCETTFSNRNSTGRQTLIGVENRFGYIIERDS